MKSLSSARYCFLVIILAMSFWSSGVILIRFLTTLNTWSLSPQLGLLYGLSVPVIFISIRGVENLFIRLGHRQTASIYHVTGLVLMLHAIVITLFPTLYFFTPQTSLYATSWLLWFGGVVLMLQTRNVVSK